MDLFPETGVFISQPVAVSSRYPLSLIDSARDGEFVASSIRRNKYFVDEPFVE